MRSPDLPSPVEVRLDLSEEGVLRLGVASVSSVPDSIGACLSGAVAGQTVQRTGAVLASRLFDVPSAGD